MDIIELDIDVDQAFGNLYRPRCVLVAVRNSEGKVLTGAKPQFLPPGMTRLLGGGVNESEAPIAAAVRELAEELSMIAATADLTPLAQFNTHATNATGEKFYNETYLYAVNIGNAPYTAGDDVAHIVPLTVDELRALGRAYADLPEHLWYRGDEGGFRWRDYGKLYSVVHMVAADKIAGLTMSLAL